jgi:hypothetical protein
VDAIQCTVVVVVSREPRLLLHKYLYNHMYLYVYRLCSSDVKQRVTTPPPPPPQKKNQSCLMNLHTCTTVEDLEGPAPFFLKFTKYSL